MNAKPILRMENVSKHFDGIKIVNNVSVKIQSNTINALIGPNGSGKTTLINLITGHYKVTSGNIFFNNQIITNKEPYKIARLGISRTFQNIRIFQQISVQENIQLACHNTKCIKLLFENFKLPYFKNLETKSILESHKYLNLIGLFHIKDKFAEDLSHGQKKLLEIARTLATSSTFIILDEPTSGVFPEAKRKIINILKELKKLSNITILFIEHDMSVVKELADNVIVLDQGKKIGEGIPNDIFQNREVLDSYFGRGL